MANAAGWINVGGTTVVGTATITAADDRLAITAHGLADGDLVMVDTLSGGGTELREGSTYVVRNPGTDDFQISTPSGNAVFDFQADGSARVLTAVPSYAASDLRRIDAIHLHPGSADRLGAREGVRPHSSDAVTIAAGTYTVAAGTAVVYPAETTTSGPYPVTYDAVSDSVDPADGSNPRLDGVDLQVQDDDEDGSGQRRVQIVYVPGTPASSPTAPTVTTNALRLATILVPAGDETASTIDSLAQYALGAGVLPVRDTSERPTAGRYEGMYVDRTDVDSLERWDGSAWQTVASGQGFQYWQTLIFTTSDSFTKSNFPGLRAVRARCQGGGGGGGGAVDTTGVSEAATGTGGRGGNYAESWILESALLSTETVTVGSGGGGGAGASGTDGGASSFGAHASGGGGAGGIAAGSSAGWGGADAPSSAGAATGDLRFFGSAGGGSLQNGTESAAWSGEGGSSHLGGGGRGRRASSITRAGGNGVAYGGGGGGAASAGNSSSESGGDGAPGVVILELFV